MRPNDKKGAGQEGLNAPPLKGLRLYTFLLRKGEKVDVSNTRFITLDLVCKDAYHRTMKMPSPVEYKLLTSLGVREVSGRDLAKRYEADQGTSISYGTLYTAMRRLKESGWVEARDADEPDRRVRYFRLSAYGQKMWPELEKLRTMLLGWEVPA